MLAGSREEPIPRLRDYQLEHEKAAFTELAYRGSTLDVLATGGGKTHLMGAAARIHYKQGGRRVLVLAPREELLEHAHRHVRAWNPYLRRLDVGWEQAQQIANPGHRLVLGSVQSLTQSRAERMPAPSLILADEAHLHYKRLTELWKVWPDVPKIGYTATPDRRDRERLVPKLFESVCAVTELRDLVDRGFLVPPVDLEGNEGAQRIEIKGVRLDDVAVDLRGDFQQESLSKLMRRHDVVQATAAAVTDYQGDRPTVVFAVDVAHAQLLAEVINRRKPGSARAIDGYLARGQRQEIQRAFFAGEFQTIVAVMLLAYGWDAPLASCIVMARPTTSRNLCSQMVGRGLRTYTSDQVLAYLGEPWQKRNCLWLDLVGNSEEHQLVTPADVLAVDQELEEEVRATRASDEAIAHSGDVPVELLLVADEDDEPAEEPEELADEVELLAVLGTVAGQLSASGVDLPERDPLEVDATAEQLHVLRALGLDVGLGDGLGQLQAGAISGHLEKRRDEGLCKPGLARILHGCGLNPDAPQADAVTAVELLRKNRWRTGGIFHELPESVLYRSTRVSVMKRRVAA